jgi:hypothetical protein
VWVVSNHTPYKVGKTWARNKEGVHEWIVVVKGTFDIKADGTLKLADEQLDPLLLPEYRGDPGESSLRYDADLVTSKPTTDIVVNGTAYAPNGRPSTDFLASVQVGRVRKVIRVFGNRWWGPGPIGGSPSAPDAITQVPIVYERAYGGYDHTDPDPRNHRLDTRNPVGCGVVARPEDRVGTAAPNFEYPDRSLESAGPAGFGALDLHWSPRRELLGTYDETWKKTRYPLVPVDWDPRSVLCSPADQRPEKPLEGGELVELHNLTPSGVLRFALPRIRLGFRTIFSTDFRTRPIEHEGCLATVILEPDHARTILVWSSILTCRKDMDYLEETIVREVSNTT